MNFLENINRPIKSTFFSKEDYLEADNAIDISLETCLLYEELNQAFMEITEAFKLEDIEVSS